MLTTGGTIFSESNSRLDLFNYKSGQDKKNLVLNQIPEVKDIANLHVEQIDNISSCDIVPYHWNLLKDKVNGYISKPEFDGVVITHGTNTLEETAYFLHLTCDTEKPIVLVGSQRPPSALSTDATLNLLNAVRLAASPNAIGKGILVMLNDEINSAREVTKTNTYRVEAFQSGQLGFLGYVDVDGMVCFYRETTKIHTSRSIFKMVDTTNLNKVEIVYSYAGADGGLIQLLFNTDCKGIVIAGTGAGKFSQKECEALIKARERGIHVVRSNRVGNGRVVPLKQYEPYGFISADNLLPQKARILLMLALKVTDNVGEIQEIFNKY